MITFIVALLAFTLSFIIFQKCRWIWSIRKMHKNGTYEQEEDLTLFDVKELLIEGEYEAAVTVYCKIFKCGYFEGKKAVDSLQRSINELNN